MRPSFRFAFISSAIWLAVGIGQGSACAQAARAAVSETAPGAASSTPPQVSTPADLDSLSAGCGRQGPHSGL